MLLSDSDKTEDQLDHFQSSRGRSIHPRALASEKLRRDPCLFPRGFISKSTLGRNQTSPEVTRPVSRTQSSAPPVSACQCCLGHCQQIRLSHEATVAAGLWLGKDQSWARDPGTEPLVEQQIATLKCRNKYPPNPMFSQHAIMSAPLLATFHAHKHVITFGSNLWLPFFF